MTSPIPGRPLKLYISATDESLGCFLAQDDDEGRERAIYYVSRLLTITEKRYPPIEKLCLALFTASVKLHHYMILRTVHVISKVHLVRYMLHRPSLTGRIGKWALSLMDYQFQHIPQSAVKGQALADFLAEHPMVEVEVTEVDTADQKRVNSGLWMLNLDGSSTFVRSGAGVVITSPRGHKYRFAITLGFQCTNNQAEYEALVQGLQILLEQQVKVVEVYGDSMLIIQQVKGNCQCKDTTLRKSLCIVQQLQGQFEHAEFFHIYRDQKKEANYMAQVASGFVTPSAGSGAFDTVELYEPSHVMSEVAIQPCCHQEVVDDWRSPLIRFLDNPNKEVEAKVRRQAVRYLLVDQQLFRRTEDEVLLRCIGKAESTLVMLEVHEGLCGAYQSGRRMAWLIKRYGYERRRSNLSEQTICCHFLFPDKRLGLFKESKAGYSI